MLVLPRGPSHLFHSPALQLISPSLAGSGSFGGWVLVLQTSVIFATSKHLSLLLTVGMHSLLSAQALSSSPTFFRSGG